MHRLPDNIIHFIERHHVVSLATLDEQGLWCANCFYSFDSDNAGLIILSNTTTRHGKAMQAMPAISGTIAAQPESILDIQGIQFTARASLLQGQSAKQALQRYYTRHPLARLKKAEIWSLEFDSIKFTDNALRFGHKTRWQRDRQSTDTETEAAAS